jgi:general secretion pathway protein F
MAAFSYRALDSSGLQANGNLEAENARQARAMLRDRGLFPVSIEAVTRNESDTRKTRLGASELCLITRQFSALLSSGLTVEQALAALVEQADSKGARLILAGVRSDVMSGHSLPRPHWIVLDTPSRLFTARPLPPAKSPGSWPRS